MRESETPLLNKSPIILLGKSYLSNYFVSILYLYVNNTVFSLCKAILISIIKLRQRFYEILIFGAAVFSIVVAAYFALHYVSKKNKEIELSYLL